MVMHLQREHSTGLHDQALDLEALPGVDAVVAAPRPENLSMQRMLVAVLRLEPYHQPLHFLDAILGGHEHRILRLDDDKVA